MRLKFTRRHGYALLMVLVIVGVAALTAGSTMSRTYTVSSLNQRAKQYQGSMYAAEAAVEKVYARFRYDYLTGGHAAISNNLAMYRTNYPANSENTFWANYEFSDAQGNPNRTYVNLTQDQAYQVLDGNYAGLNGWRGIYRVISNARPLTGYHQVAAGVQQEIALDIIPAFQFAIFYNSQLEFTGCATLTVRGRTHANGPICMGAASGNTLTFNGLVTTTSQIVVSNMAGYSSFTTPVYNGTPSPGKKTGQPTLQLPIGQNNTAAAVREIIGVPAAGDSAALAEQRYFNKAGVVLLISNNTVTVNVKTLGALPAASFISSNYTFSSYSNSSANASVFTASNIVYQRTQLANYVPFLNLTNRFQDYREGDWVMPTDINMGILKDWVRTNNAVTNKFPAGSGTYPTIMYVGDFRTVTNLHAVRVVNGSLIPTNGPSAAQALGFTLATINPIYVWGDYNTPNSTHKGTENVSATFPASLVGDAITILSDNWVDKTYGSTTALSSRTAKDTTVNAAIIVGSVYTSSSAVGDFSGGVVNLTRLLENWTGFKLTLNSSLVNLYNSVRADQQFQNPTVYYNAPTRNFNFNTNYLISAKLPPGTPMVPVISRYKWTIAPINTVTYNGP